LLGSIYGEVDIASGLTFRSVASVDYISNRDDQWQPEYLVAEMGLNRPGNQFVDTRGEGVTQVFTNTLNYNFNLRDHNFDVLTGLEYQQIRGNTLGVRGNDFISTSRDFFMVVNTGRGDPMVSGGAGQSAFVGYLGRISYNYKEKYLLTGTVRRDGTSNFSPVDNRRWGTFPSFSGAWRVSEEAFFNNSGIINELKIRASWGQLGNSNTQPFPHVFRVSTTPDYALGGSNTIQAPVPINFVNQDVVWETVETIDIGFDMSLFNNKVDILATYYDRTTKDFLFSLPLPALTGFSNTPVNLGTVSNRGVELEIGYSNTFNNGLNMQLSGNITTIRNRLEELAPGLEEFTSSAIYRTAVGRPIGYFFGYRTDGIWQTQEEIDAVFTGGFEDLNSPQGPRPGDVRFLDVNGPGEETQFSGEPDGRIDFNDRTYIGKTIPSFFYGLSANFSYKDFDLNLLFQGVGDVQIYNEVRRNGLNLGGAGRNMLIETQERWTGPGTSNSIPRAISGDLNQNNRFSDRFIENAGFLRLRNVQVGYNLPQSLLERWEGFKSGRIYIGGTNLLTFTNYTGMDPEVMTYGQNSNQIGAGTDRGNMPQPRIYQLGIQLSF
jgi:TonB-dependent starch-binding outer membrane protein SusC